MSENFHDALAKILWKGVSQINQISLNISSALSGIMMQASQICI